MLRLCGIPGRHVLLGNRAAVPVSILNRLRRHFRFLNILRRTGPIFLCCISIYRIIGRNPGFTRALHVFRLRSCLLSFRFRFLRGPLDRSGVLRRLRNRLIPVSRFLRGGLFRGILLRFVRPGEYIRDCLLHSIPLLACGIPQLRAGFLNQLPNRFRVSQNLFRRVVAYLTGFRELCQCLVQRVHLRCHSFLRLVHVQRLLNGLIGLLLRCFQGHLLIRNCHLRLLFRRGCRCFLLHLRIPAGLDILKAPLNRGGNRAHNAAGYGSADCVPGKGNRLVPQRILGCRLLVKALLTVFLDILPIVRFPGHNQQIRRVVRQRRIEFLRAFRQHLTEDRLKRRF